MVRGVIRFVCLGAVVVAASGCAVSRTSVPTPEGRATSLTWSLFNAGVHENEKQITGTMITPEGFMLELNGSGRLQGLESREELSEALAAIGRMLALL